jgi:hypothetical protein
MAGADWGGRRTVVAVVVAVLGVASVIGVALLGVDEAELGNAGNRSAGGEATTTTAEPPTTSTRPPTTTTTTPPPEWSQVTAPDGSFRLELPASWAYAPPSSDPASVGAQMFPDNASRAEVVAPIAGALTTPETRLLAVDGSQLVGGSAQVPDVVIIDAQEGLPSLDYPTVLAAARQFPGETTETGVDGRLTSVVGEIASLELSVPSIGMNGVRYFVIHSDALWLLTFWSDDLAATRPRADHIAASFDPR